MSVENDNPKEFFKISEKLIYGLHVRKLTKNKKSSRICSIYLCPTDMNFLCWATKKKKLEKARININEAKIAKVSPTMGFISKKWKERYFIDISNPQRSLVIGFCNEKERDQLLYFLQEKTFNLKQGKHLEIDLNHLRNKFEGKNEFEYLRGLKIKEMTETQKKRFYKNFYKLKKEKIKIKKKKTKYQMYITSEDLLQSLLIAPINYYKIFDDTRNFSIDMFKDLKNSQLENFSYNEFKRLFKDFVIDLETPKSGICSDKKYEIKIIGESVNLFLNSRLNTIITNYEDIRYFCKKKSKNYLSEIENYNEFDIYERRINELFIKSSSMKSFYDSSKNSNLEIILKSLENLIKKNVRLFELKIQKVFFTNYLFSKVKEIL